MDFHLINLASFLLASHNAIFFSFVQPSMSMFFQMGLNGF